MIATAHIGMFRKTHALKGELNATLDVDVDYFTSSGQRRWIVVDIEGIPVPFEVESARAKGHFSLLLKLSGVDTEAAARQFVNKDISVPEADLKAYEELYCDDESEGEGMYTSDLIGFTVINGDDGSEIGVIDDVDLSTENALFEIESGGERILIPAADEYILAMDGDERKITVSLPPGLLDINQKS